MQTIGNRIRMRRKELGLTIPELSQKTNISNGNLSGIENDKNTPGAIALISLSEALECTTDWILKGTDNELKIDDENFVLTNIIVSDNDLIKYFHKISERDQMEIIDLIKMKTIRSDKEIKSALKKQENIVNKANKDRTIFFE